MERTGASERQGQSQESVLLLELGSRLAQASAPVLRPYVVFALGVFENLAQTPFNLSWLERVLLLPQSHCDQNPWNRSCVPHPGWSRLAV